MTIINQTNRTLLLEEINQYLECRSYEEFQEKFAPCIYSFFDANTQSVRYTLKKPENIPENMLTEIPLNQSNDFLKMLFTLMESKKSQGVLNVDFGFENLLDMISPKKVMDDIRQVRKDDLISKLGGFVTFGGNIMQQKRTKMNASAGTLLVPDLFDVNNGVDKPSITSSLTQRKMNSLYGSLQLNWDGWLFLDVTARNDWSSTMSKENRSYFYPSVSLSAVISDMVQKNRKSCSQDWM